MPLRIDSASRVYDPLLVHRRNVVGLDALSGITFKPEIASHVGFDALAEYIELFGMLKPPHIAKPLTDPNDWIVVDENYPYYMEVKRELDERIPNEVFMAYEDTEAASLEVLDLLVAQYPQYFERSHHLVTNKITGEEFDLREQGNHPLKVAGKLVPNDLLLTRKIGDKYFLVAGSVHLPSKWSLESKMGKSLAGVHYEEKGGEVTGFEVYKERLEKQVDAYFDKMPADKLSIRFVPMVHPEPEISQHPSLYTNPAPKVYNPQNVGDELWIRTERETFRRLADNNDFILMTIHPFYEPLDLVEERPDLAKNLFDFHTLMDDKYRQYRSDLQMFYEPLVEYLQSKFRSVV